MGKSKLLCKACHEELSLKKNIIVSHVSSVQSCTTFVMTALYNAIFSGCYCFDKVLHKNNERILGQIIGKMM